MGFGHVKPAIGFSLKFKPVPCGARTDGSAAYRCSLAGMSWTGLPLLSHLTHMPHFSRCGITSQSCISSQFNLLIFMGAVPKCLRCGAEKQVTGKDVAASYWSYYGWVHLLMWHLLSIRTLAPTEFLPFQQLLWFWLLVVFCFLRSLHLLYW